MSKNKHTIEALKDRIAYLENVVIILVDRDPDEVVITPMDFYYAKKKRLRFINSTIKWTVIKTRKVMR